MIRRIGIDTLGVDRMALAVRRSGEGFLARVFTPAELAYCAGRSERLAGRWAAKEAVIKCFDGTPICFPRRRIEVLAAPGGAPRVHLLGDARGARVQLSITHQAGIAIASAELEMPDPGEMPLPAPDAVALPARLLDAHKGSFGSVVVVAGSEGLTGAAYLSATAAARAGAGLVRLLVAEAIYPILATKCTEVMAAPVPEVVTGAIGHAATNTVLAQVDEAEAAVIGPGLGSHSSTWRMALEVVARARVPLVIDADALNALAENRRAQARLGPTRVLTPHPGEMARLLRRTTAEIQADRRGAALELAATTGAVVVLKGAKSLVALADGTCSEDPHQVPALATGGTGDVLAGLIGGLLAQGSSPYTAAVTAVYVHAEAGRRIEARAGSSGLLASDLLAEIPQVMKMLREGGL